MFLCYIAAFAGWWYLSPKGFSVGHPRFWSNSVIPIVVVLASLACLIGVSRRYRRVLALIIPAYPAGTAAFIAAGVLLYPISMRALFLVPLIIWLVILIALAFCVLKNSPLRKMDWLAAALLAIFAAAIGAVLPYSQQSPSASTKPLNVPETIASDPVLSMDESFLELTGQVEVFPVKAVVTLHDVGTSLGISPYLTFYSKSPDRGWILLAPRAHRLGGRSDYDGVRRIDNGFHSEYSDPGKGSLDVSVPQPGLVVLDACCQLFEPIYSHLNTFTQFTVEGREKIYVSFSPCPNERIEVTAFDYPFGRPCRLAFLDEAGTFRVVQSSSAEKGPFETLAAGPLAADQPLEIVLYDGDRPIYSVTFDDWAAQCSRELSPTAGWGVPQNAIEFSLNGEDQTQATFYVTLASTSAGRGFDSVGHNPGVYRNRMKVRFLNQ